MLLLNVFVYINECIDVKTALKNPSNLGVVQVGYISLQEISYAGKPQVVSSYILSNLWLESNRGPSVYEVNIIPLCERTMDHVGES